MMTIESGLGETACHSNRRRLLHMHLTDIPERENSCSAPLLNITNRMPETLHFLIQEQSKMRRDKGSRFNFECNRQQAFCAQHTYLLHSSLQTQDCFLKVMVEHLLALAPLSPSTPADQVPQESKRSEHETQDCD